MLVLTVIATVVDVLVNVEKSKKELVLISLIFSCPREAVQCQARICR